MKSAWIGSFFACVAILVGLSLYGWLSGRWERDPLNYDLASAQTIPCTSAEEVEKIRVIMLEALDEALKHQIVHVFEVWMKDERDQPTRARTGTRQAVRAYIGSRKGVAEWQPMVC